MSDSDNIFREVEEDLRREQLVRLWDKYGIYVLALGGLIILGVGGFNGYRWYLNKQAMEYGTTYFQATQAFEDQKYGDASASLGKLAKEAPGGYRVLAKLELAAVHLKEGRKSEAVTLYDEVARDSAADGILKDFAKVQSAAVRIDEADNAEIIRRLDKIDADTNPWRHSARELLALSAYRSGNTAESEKLFTRILTDQGAPDDMRQRAQSMLALMVKTSGTPGTAAAEPGKAPASPPKDAATQ